MQFCALLLGVEYPVLVELAPCQKIPKSKGGEMASKKDAKCATIFEGIKSVTEFDHFLPDQSARDLRVGQGSINYEIVVVVRCRLFGVH